MSFFDFFKTNSSKGKSIIPLQNQAEASSWFKWNIKNGILTVYGNGPLPDYEKDEVRPWDSQLELIEEVVVGTGITSSGTYTFTRIPNLKKSPLKKIVC